MGRWLEPSVKTLSSQALSYFRGIVLNGKTVFCFLEEPTIKPTTVTFIDCATMPKCLFITNLCIAFAPYCLKISV